jgi:hypothetical protein
MRVFNVPLSTGSVASSSCVVTKAAIETLVPASGWSLNANQPGCPLTRADRDIIYQLLVEDTPERLSELRNALRREHASRTASPDSSALVVEEVDW